MNNACVNAEFYPSPASQQIYRFYSRTNMWEVPLNAIRRQSRRQTWTTKRDSNCSMCWTSKWFYALANIVRNQIPYWIIRIAHRTATDSTSRCSYRLLLKWNSNTHPNGFVASFEKLKTIWQRHRPATGALQVNHSATNWKKWTRNSKRCCTSKHMQFYANQKSVSAQCSAPIGHPSLSYFFSIYISDWFK